VSDASLQPILALLGCPVAANPTQYMVEKAFAHHRLDCRFLTLEVTPENLGDAVRGMRAMNFLGGMCADPHKRTVIEHLSQISDAARLAGAVNCLVRQESDLVGENTEGQGVLRALRPLVDPAGKRVVLLGAGNVARAIAVELALAKAAEIVIVNRTATRAVELAAMLGQRLQATASAVPWDEDYAIPAEADILVNATAIGREDPEACPPLVRESLRRGLIVADVTLNPPRTRLLSEAAGRGCRTIDGLDIFIQQAAVALKRWTGVQSDVTVMREAVEEFLLV